MNVSAIIVTRGDVDLEPIFDTLPPEWERVVYDNGVPEVRRWKSGGWLASYRGNEHETLGDLAVYGRYFPLSREGLCWGDVIYVQDDDCIVSDPQAIVGTLRENLTWSIDHQFQDSYVCDCEVCAVVVCNMPEQFRHDGYTDHALVGFGAAFHRDLPERAFRRFVDEDAARRTLATAGDRYVWPSWAPEHFGIGEFFNRTCDIVFTGLTPRVLVDVPYTDRGFASDPGRMWTTKGHVEERQRMRDLVRQVRDGN